MAAVRFPMSSPTAHIFAPPPQRAILQPSLHPRGGRPFVFSGEIDSVHAPGALIKNGATRCAVDAAFLVERILGEPKRVPAMWPGVPGARERAYQLGQQEREDGLRPYAYQLEGAAFLAERDYALLLDEMGVGKTSQALLAAEARLSLASIPAPTTPVVLILCPALAKRHWQREVMKWTGHEAAVLESLTPTELPQNRYIIANYDILYGAQRRDAAGVVFGVDHLPGWAMSLAGRFLIVIADEAHMLRGRQSRRTKAVKAMCRSIPVFWALTGTPVPNYIRDLWALFDVITDGLQGFSYWDWAKRYCGAVQAQYGWKDTGSDNLEELQARMTFFCLGRTSASVNMQLPEKRREIFRVDVTVTAPTVHEGHLAMAKGGFVAKALRRTAVAKRAAVVAQTLEVLEAKQKIVVFCYMREQADEIVKAVRAKIDCPVYCVHGDLSPDGRDAQATVFRNVQAPAAFVATIDSVAVAISLVGANLVLFADLVPEPWKLLQAEKRCHRHGSTERVLVRYLIGTGTLDEAVADTVIAKLATIEQALGGADDQQELNTVLGGGKRKDEEIIGSLFERLKALGGKDDE